MTSPFKFPSIYTRGIVNNSFDQEGTNTSPTTNNIPQHNNHHFRDSSADSSESEFSTTPTTPTSTTPSIISTLNNNSNYLPILQRRASESIAETIQFKKLPARRYTISGRVNPMNPLNPLGLMNVRREDSSVHVAMEQVQFGL